jgi:hypothetical protein
VRTRCPASRNGRSLEAPLPATETASAPSLDPIKGPLCLALRPPFPFDYLIHSIRARGSLTIMMLTPPTLSHLLWSLPCLLWLQLLMSSTRASPMTRLSCWKGSSVPYTSFARRGGDHPGAASSAETPLTSSLIVPRERSSTPPISMTMPTGTTPATRAIIRRRTASETRRRRSSRRSCPDCVLP